MTRLNLLGKLTLMAVMGGSALLIPASVHAKGGHAHVSGHTTKVVTGHSKTVVTGHSKTVVAGHTTKVAVGHKGTVLAGHGTTVVAGHGTKITSTTVVAGRARFGMATRMGVKYAQTYGVRLPGGLYGYRGINHVHWGRRFYSPVWRCWTWYDPSTLAWYYWSARGLYLPVRRLAFVAPVRAELPPGASEIPLAVSDGPSLPEPR
jgi:hypothetical protein